MALEGQLSDFGLPDIFQLISIQQKTGVLDLIGPTDKASIRFQNGDIINVSSTSRGSMTQVLQNFLIMGGKLTREDVQQIEETAKSSNLKFEKVLVTGRYLSAEELQDAMRQIMEETIYDLFTWKEASYSFTAESGTTLPPFPAVVIRADGLLMEGMRRIDEWPQIIMLIPNQNMSFDKNPDLPVNPDELPPDEARLYTRLDGQISVKELVDNMALGRYRTYESLSNLVRADLIVPVEKATRPKTDKSGVNVKSYFVTLLQYVITFIFPVLILIAILIGRFVYNMMVVQNQPVSGEIREIVVQNDQYRLKQALRAYYFLHGAFPNSINNLVTEGIINAKQRDEFESNFSYRQIDNGANYSFKPKRR